MSFACEYFFNSDIKYEYSKKGIAQVKRERGRGGCAGGEVK